MKIRAITYFCNPKFPLDEEAIHAAGLFLARARAAYHSAGYEVQTTRLATIPFPSLLGESKLSSLPKLAGQLGLLTENAGIGYASLGPALPESHRSYEVIPEAMAAARGIFFGGLMADRARGIDLAAIRLCAQVIVRCASIESNGFANLRFAALANVGPGSPFFPAAYHGRDEPAFAVATEAADLAVAAFTSARTLDEGRQTLMAEIEKHGKALARVAQDLTTVPIPEFQIPSPMFEGLDFSLAPFASGSTSLGTAFERLGVPHAGLHGSLAAAGILTESINHALEKARIPHTGFSGLLLPVLEDATLAQRAAEGRLTVKDLLLYSAVCGTGLDTIPLPGDTSPEQIAPLLLDLCVLALRLDKPLTARLLPIPNKKVGDPTDFDFAFFANSKVMALDSEGLHGVLNGDETFSLKAR
jgi:hypothetical protein